MKKSLSLICGLFGVVAVQAQYNNVQPYPTQLMENMNVIAKDKDALNIPSNSNSGHSLFAAGDTIVYWGFSGGPQNWVPVVVSSPKGNQGGWKHSFTGPTGQYSTNTPVIASATSGNGFFLLDADGDNTPGSNFSPVNAHITSPTVNCTNYPGVILEFQHYFRPFTNAELIVAISTNGGTTWPAANEFNVRDGVPTNTASANPVNVKLNISSIAGGQADVKIRFHWRGESHYFWMVDDVKLVEAPANDLALRSTLYKGLLDTSAFKFHYTEIPERQANRDTLRLGGEYINNGTAIQPNTRIKANLTGPGGFSWNGQSASKNVGVNNISWDETTNFVIPNGGKGNYFATISVESDSTDFNTSDNSLSYAFKVTDTTYSRDRDNIAFINRRTDGRVLGNRYDIHLPDTASSMSVYIGSTTASSSIGSKIKMYLYAATTTGFQIVAQTPIETITSNGLKTYPINPPIPLTAGATYLVALEVLQDTAWVGIDIENRPPLYTTYENIGAQLGQGGTWYYANFNSTPYLRLHVRPFLCANFSATTSVTNTPCGVANGQITVNATGGQGTLNYAWEPLSNNGSSAGSGSSNVITGLYGGPYRVTVSDANGCSDIKNVNIVNLGAPAISNANVIREDCFGDENGSIAITVSGGTAPLTYAWNTGSSSTTGIQNLKAGFYTLTITDSQSPPCEQIQTFSVPGPSDSLRAATTRDHVTCFGLTNGRITLTASGGTSPYSITWSGPTTVPANTYTAQNLAGGSYNITVTDAHSCTRVREVMVNEPSDISVSGTVNDVNPTGSISINVSGGSPPYTFKWTNPVGGTSQSQNQNNVGIQGTWTVEVTDVQGCIKTQTFTVAGRVSVENIKGSATNNVAIFPNPTDGLLNIKLNGYEKDNYTVRVSNVVGQVVYSSNIIGKGNLNTIDLKSMNKGMYFVTIIGDDVEVTSKVMIK
jgi:hypothetical protein